MTPNANSAGKTPTPVRVFLADDHQVMIECLRVLILQHPHLEIAGTAFTCEEAWSGILHTQPDVVVLDLEIPTEGGLSLLPRLLRERPGLRVVVLSAHEAPAKINAALSAGASGYVLKLDATSELIEALRVVLRGGTYVTPRVAAVIADDVRRRSARSGDPRGLTPREREVMRRIAEGESTKEIAGALNLSSRTVDTHRQRIMDKTGARGIAGLTKIALREGMIDP